MCPVCLHAGYHNDNNADGDHHYDNDNYDHDNHDDTLVEFSYSFELFNFSCTG